jgi:hypothetical protein
MRPCAAQGETQIEGAKLDILKKQEPRATIAANTGKRKQQQADDSHKYGQHEVDLASRDSTQAIRPSPFDLRHHPGLVG